MLSHLLKDHLAVDRTDLSEDSSCFAVLGLHWQANKDVFTFKVNCTPIVEKITNRQVLSKLAQIFDPMGWIAPIIISAKVFMQSLWLLKCDWDDTLPLEYAEK